MAIDFDEFLTLTDGAEIEVEGLTGRIDADYADDHFRDKEVLGLKAIDTKHGPAVLVTLNVDDNDIIEAQWEDKRNEELMAADFKCDQARDLAMEAAREIRT